MIRILLFNRVILTAIALFVATSSVACGSDDVDTGQAGDFGTEEPEADPEDDDCPSGHLEGVTCDGPGEPDPDAVITIEGEDCKGIPFVEVTDSDSDGYYFLPNLPAGEHTKTISLGSFGTMAPVTIVADETTSTSPGTSVCQ